MRNYPQLSPDQQLLHVFCDLYPWLDQVTVVLDGQTNTDYEETFQPKGEVVILLDLNGSCQPFCVPNSVLDEVENFSEWIGSSPYWSKKFAKSMGHREAAR